MKYIDDISSPMGNINYPLREALKAQDVKQDELIKKIRKSRQTVSRYITQYEQYGKVGDESAQQEFDRIMALEKQRIAGLTNNGTRINQAREEKKRAEERMKRYGKEFEELLHEILDNHPDVLLYDMGGKEITRDEAESNPLFTLDSNGALMDTLTPSERSRLDALEGELWKSFRMRDDSEMMEEACDLENLWDATRSEGRPVTYRDRMHCETVIGDVPENEDVECNTFCLCHGDSARIYVTGADSLYHIYGFRVAVYANVYVITDKRIFEVATEVRLDKEEFFGVSGTVDGLIPGYKYVYDYFIVGDDDDHPLPWEFNSHVYHPLK